MKFLGHTYEAIEQVLGAVPNKLERLNGGRNNLVIRATHPELGSIIIKDYLKDSYDGLERLSREWTYLEHLNENKVQDIPMPLFKDARNGYAIYSEMKGLKLSSELITEDHVKSAAQHIVVLSKTSIGKIYPAKGRQSTLAGHIADVKQRMARLRKVADMHNEESALQRFLNKYLEPLWVKRQVEAEKNTNKFFEYIEYSLSPSDFGFHNILSDQNRLSFIDFEYAGTDDLAKLTVDFLLAPAVPINGEQSYLFCKYLRNDAKVDSYLFERVKTLYPIAQIKWICIILNDFIETEACRKDLAVQKEKTKRLKQQLFIAKQRYNHAIIGNLMI